LGNLTHETGRRPGNGVVSHVGVHALGSFADRIGLGHVISGAIPQRPTLVHDRGKVLVQAMLALAGGGESCADIEQLRCEPTLFGPVCSDTTLQRAVHEVDEATRTAVAEAVAPVRAEARRRCSPRSGPVVLDIDSSLVEIHSEGKDKAAPTYKGGYGFHPILCLADDTGEALAGILRPGNAGANTAADHVAVLDAAICQLEAEARTGHGPGEDASLVSRQVICRTDSGGTTKAFLAAMRDRNVNFVTSSMTSTEVQAAILNAVGLEEVWRPAVTKMGEEREGAFVCELPSLVDLTGFPEGTRLVPSAASSPPSSTAATASTPRRQQPERLLREHSISSATGRRNNPTTTQQPESGGVRKTPCWGNPSGAPGPLTLRKAERFQPGRDSPGSGIRYS
jgi:hypothetical protein